MFNRSMAMTESERRLDTQHELLKHTMMSFDEGFVRAYIHTTVTLRVMLHDTKLSTSLFKHLGVKDSLQFISSARVDLENLAPMSALTDIEIVTHGDGTGRVRYAPILQQAIVDDGRLMSFDDWWAEPVIRDSEGVMFTRRDIVLFICHKDGGAHLDATPEKFRQLDRNGSMGWTIFAEDDDQDSGQLVLLSPLPATVRTIADEVHLTISNNAELMAAALA